MPSFFPLPEGISPLIATIVVLTTFFSAAITAAFAVGGGLLLIAVMSTLLPAPAVVPVHGLIMTGVNGGRAIVFRDSIDRRTVMYFLGGAVIGASLGSTIATDLPATALQLLVAGFILATQWGPPWRLPFGSRSFVVAGAFSTVLTLFVGASGPFITTLIAQLPRFGRRMVTATAAACMVAQHGLKSVVFALAGFLYAPWLPLIVLAVTASYGGTLVGERLLRRLDEGKFRRGLKWILTGLAVILILRALWGGR
ncbi:putative orphan protein [Parvularcula bermudensis HTCC2503]|uniref:Probable membrane transporter protein n=1 Tax=Parvularcula bermudensis (strain ATCC BAA-594 / HTCC2503 / KCTC 12087) TaxID=314260 RepID=E0TEL4_PARBH|nr:sulfite exporter TauE/SafE family protein [Parvularcula bermudensis]ADM08897.1 putative orphan protein [Parvularcula bermudensis HTCC2503]